MNRFFIIPLLFVYLTMSVGVTIMVHTCGGESEAMVATTSAEDPCGCGDLMPEERCCTTELSTVKLSDEQKSASALAELQWTLLGTLPAAPSIVSPAVDLDTPLQSSIDPSPPPDDLCIVHSVFLI